MIHSMKKGDIEEARESLASATVEFIQWFSNNQMKTYPENKQKWGHSSKCRK